MTILTVRVDCPSTAQPGMLLQGLLYRFRRVRWQEVSRSHRLRATGRRKAGLGQRESESIVNNFRDTLSLIDEVGSPHLKACMDINIEDDPESESRAREMVAASGSRQVHSHVNGEFVRNGQGQVVLAGAGYFDDRFWGRKVAYPAYFDALAAAGYEGFLDWEFCHPAKENGVPAGIEYVHNQTELALEYMRTLRANAMAKAAQRVDRESEGW
jgi:sugar phosphate isomerase/epimerase